MRQKKIDLSNLTNPYSFFIRRESAAAPAFVRLVLPNGDVLKQVCYKSQVAYFRRERQEFWAREFNVLGMICEAALGDDPMADDEYYPISVHQWKRRANKLNSHRVWGRRHVNSMATLTLAQKLVMFKEVLGYKPTVGQIKVARRVAPDVLVKPRTPNERLQAAGLLDGLDGPASGLGAVLDEDGNEAEVWAGVGIIDSTGLGAK